MKMMCTHRASELLGSRPSSRLTVHVTDAYKYIHHLALQNQQHGMRGGERPHLFNMVLVDIDSGVHAAYSEGLPRENKTSTYAQTDDITSTHPCGKSGRQSVCSRGKHYSPCSCTVAECLMAPPAWLLEESFVRALADCMTADGVSVPQPPDLFLFYNTILQTCR
jgi:hypothetical protein